MVRFSNGAAYVNPKIDELFAEAAQYPDIVARGEIYAEIQQMLTDELPYLWLVETKFTAASSANVSGLMPWSGHVAEQAQMGQ